MIIFYLLLTIFSQGGYSIQVKQDDTHQDRNVDQSRSEMHKPAYHYEYGVISDETGDFKNLKEVRDGDHVKGQYHLKDPDGFTRSVHYTVDKDKGYQATVTRHKGLHKIIDTIPPRYKMSRKPHWRRPPIVIEDHHKNKYMMQPYEIKNDATLQQNIIMMKNPVNMRGYPLIQTFNNHNNRAVQPYKLIKHHHRNNLETQPFKLIEDHHRNNPGMQSYNHHHQNHPEMLPFESIKNNHQNNPSKILDHYKQDNAIMQPLKLIQDYSQTNPVMPLKHHQNNPSFNFKEDYPMQPIKLVEDHNQNIPVMHLIEDHHQNNPLKLFEHHKQDNSIIENHKQSNSVMQLVEDHHQNNIVKLFENDNQDNPIMQPLKLIQDYSQNNAIMQPLKRIKNHHQNNPSLNFKEDNPIMQPLKLVEDHSQNNPVINFIEDHHQNNPVMNLIENHPQNKPIIQLIKDHPLMQPFKFLKDHQPNVVVEHQYPKKQMKKFRKKVKKRPVVYYDDEKQHLTNHIPTPFEEPMKMKKPPKGPYIHQIPDPKNRHKDKYILPDYSNSFGNEKEQGSAEPGFLESLTSMLMGDFAKEEKPVIIHRMKGVGKPSPYYNLKDVHPRKFVKRHNRYQSRNMKDHFTFYN